MTKQSWIIAIVIFIFAFALRFNQYANNSPFDWDQNRDYSEVSQLAKGKFPILGPVAKGEGGFYLGSLYYYLLYPAYYFMSGSLSSLPLTSLTIDAIVAGLIFLLLTKIIGKNKSILLAIFWSVSWFLIATSRISWNVALVPLWSLFTIYALQKTIDDNSTNHFYLLGLLAGLSIHIHVSAIPIIPLLLLVFIKKIQFPVFIWIKMIVCGIIPIVPLILFDLKHQFLNLHLLRNQISYQVATKTKFLPMIIMTFTKLGKVVSGILFYKFADSLLLGLLVAALAVKSFFFDKRLLQQIAGVILMLSVILVIFLHDYGFPEYYFATAYLAILILIVGNFPKLFLYGLFGLSLILNVRAYTTQSSGFSLKVKEDIVNTLLVYPDPIDLSYNFDPGRDGGLRYLVELKGIKLDPKSRTRILLTDKTNTPLYIDGELARDLIQIGNIRTALYIVQ